MTSQTTEHWLLQKDHPRGSWRFSECRIVLPLYTIRKGVAPAARAYVLIGDRNTPRPQMPFRTDNTIDKYARDNRAPYGAIVHVELPLHNQEDCAYRVLLLLQAYGGRVGTPQSDTTYTGAIQFLGPRPAVRNWQLPLIPNLRGTQLGGVILDPGRYTAGMRLAVAGGAGAPARLIIQANPL